MPGFLFEEGKPGEHCSPHGRGRPGLLKQGVLVKEAHEALGS